MKRYAVATLLILASVNAVAGTWSNLWSTPEQQAQHLLDSGNASGAARQFSDPRRRAYAELKAGQYADAAKRLAPFNDALSQYNRGNALARSGALQPALDAYDSALKQTPLRSAVGRDAKHNRDLVARQLEQQKQSPQKNGGQNSKDKQNSQNKDGQNKDGKGQSSDQKQNQSGANKDQAQDSQQDGKSPQDSKGQNKAEQNAQSNQKKEAGSSADNKSADNGQKDNSHADQQQPKPAPANAQNSTAQKADAEQAKRDAEAAVNQLKQNQADRDAANRTSNAQREIAKADALNGKQKSAADLPIKPPTEQSLALDQWLRQIPDDPGGLLRRKFLIEHMMKQRETQP